MSDQASTLRALMANRGKEPAALGQSPCEIFTITSGKGGVGKSNVTVNLALSLVKQGARVLILDADIGMANIDILFGMDPRKNLGHVIDGECRLYDVIQKVEDGLFLIPGASGIMEIGQMPADRLGQFREDYLKLESMFDYLIVDTAAGVDPLIVNLLRGADRILLVCTPEPTAIVDAYALCKVLFGVAGSLNVEIIVNKISDEDEAKDVYGKLSVAVKHFLKQDLTYRGHVLADEAVGQAVINQKPLMLSQPSGPAAGCFSALAETLHHGSSWSQGKGFGQLFNYLIQK